MPILLADSLIASVKKLDAGDAKRVWDFLSKLFENPAQPSISLERIVQAKDKNLWSGRISQGLRAVLHQDGETRTVLYAGQHDDAYEWARLRSVERHVKTGALQIVESPEVTEQQLTEQQAKQPPTTQPALFDQHKDDYLLSLGLPPAWLPTIRKVYTEDVLLDEILHKLPEEVAERLLKLASGEFVTPPPPLPINKPVTESEDTRRRFYLLENNDALLKMLAAPLDTWTVFLHPSQQKLATSAFNGPLKVTGSAGTGKTVVALHRARYLAQQGKRVLVTSYVTTLCQNLQRSLRLLCEPAEMARITVNTVHNQALSLVNLAGEKVQPIDSNQIADLLQYFHRHSKAPLNAEALLLEWENVIQTQGIDNWDSYRSANRAGRGAPLSVKERKLVWEVFERTYESMQSKKLLDWSNLCRRARHHLTTGNVRSSFDAVIVDEVQDLGPQELMLLAQLAGNNPDALTLVGDGGQRIYAGRFTLKSLGIDVRGRSHILRLNYRTTRQIRSFADRIVGNISDDFDGGSDNRRGTRSLLDGPAPTMAGFRNQNEQTEFVIDEIKQLINGGLVPGEIAIFARRSDGLIPIEKALKAANIPNHRLNKEMVISAETVHLGTMHRAKGLEFKAVFVIDVADNQLPLPTAIKAGDAQAREDALEREKQLLYVSITRARDEAFISWAGEPSRFLQSHLNKN